MHLDGSASGVTPLSYSAHRQSQFCTLAPAGFSKLTRPKRTENEHFTFTFHCLKRISILIKFSRVLFTCVERNRCSTNHTLLLCLQTTAQTSKLSELQISVKLKEWQSWRSMTMLTCWPPWDSILANLIRIPDQLTRPDPANKCSLSLPGKPTSRHLTTYVKSGKLPTLTRNHSFFC